MNLNLGKKLAITLAATALTAGMAAVTAPRGRRARRPRRRVRRPLGRQALLRKPGRRQGLRAPVVRIGGAGPDEHDLQLVLVLGPR